MFSRREGVLSLPGPALPKHLRLTGLAERLSRLLAEPKVRIPESKVVPPKARPGVELRFKDFKGPRCWEARENEAPAMFGAPS